MKDSFVVIAFGGSQHIVSVGDQITVNHVEGNVGDTITIDTVLLHQDDKTTSVGTPNLEYTVTAEIVTQHMGPKLSIRTFKAKARTRRSRGHRQFLTTLKISKISKKTSRPTAARKAPSQKAAVPVKSKASSAKAVK